MDFFKLLNNSNNNILDQEVTTVTKSLDKLELNKSENNTLQQMEARRGARVRVVRKPGSPLNVYKGYIGDIKDYRKGNDSALIFLIALNSSQYIKFPLEHLELYKD